MCECLNLFSAPTRAWFEHAFGVPTAAQAQAWPIIHSGDNVLVTAPTGSGKTLCAFLSAVDRLMAADRPAGAVAEGSRSTGGVKVLYISPLKALAVDVAKNLQAPLEGIGAQCEARGLRAPSIRIATRSGDTTPRERRAIASHPPDILVTTPESLFLLLTSKARRILGAVETVIVDEVHALAGTKRGAHLALSLERLDLLRATAGAGRPAQRIGLSATVNPPAEAARFLGGGRPVRIVDPGERPEMDLRVVEPLKNMRDLQSANVKERAGGVQTQRADQPRISGVTPAMQRLAVRKGVEGSGPGGSSSAVVGASEDGTAGSIWPVVERSVLDEILAHRTTLVFVNSRGLAEKLTARLNDLYAESRGHGRDAGSPEGREGFARHYDAVVGGTSQLVLAHGPDDVIAMAHHGSVSKDRRKQIEERLKRGQLRCVVATSSLELGIDMGSVDLVIQISPPLSVSSGLQRVGRADHRVGGVSHALLYPLTREQIIGVAASIERMRAGEIEPLRVPRNPLDVLAQQTVAAAAMDVIKPEEWYASVRRAAPFAELERDMFDAVLGMLTGAYASEDFSAFRPPLSWDRDADLVTARPGAQRLAVTSGGTIPDRGLYTVVLPEADDGKAPRRVGELDEEMVYESRVGDVITLGTSTWQIQEITRDRVIVTPAPGRTARLPFWHGDGPGRDAGFGRALGLFLREVSAGLVDGDSSHAVDGASSRSPVDGASSRRPERSAAKPKDLSTPCFAAPVERRLHVDGLDGNAIANLARLLAEQRASTGVVPSDRDLVIERCPDEEGDWRIMLHSPYGRRVHEPWAMAVSNLLRQRYGFDGQAYAADDGIVVRIPAGEGRIDARELFLFDPDELPRLIESQVGESVLFAARFRECAARSLYMPRTEPGRRVPLWQQRLRAAQLLTAARTQRNFPLLLETARECLQDVYDLPALRRLMGEVRDGTVRLMEVETSTPSPFAESLLFGFVGQVMYQYDVPQAERSAQLLSMDPQVLERLLGGSDMTAVLDPGVIAEVEAQLAGRRFWNELPDADVMGRVARYAKTHGPFTADRLIADLGVPAEQAVHALDELKAKGEVLAGRFVDDADAGDGAGNGAEAPGSAFAPDARAQWLHREVFDRIRALSLAKARKAIKPVEMAVYQSFLLDRQGLEGLDGRRMGTDGLLEVVEQLEGVALPARVWEHEVLPIRVKDYVPAMLDELLAAGDVVWTGAEGRRVAFHPADSLLIEPPGNDGRDAFRSSAVGAAEGRLGGHAPDRRPGLGMRSLGHGNDKPRAGRPGRGEVGHDGPLPSALVSVLADGGAYRIDQLGALTRERLQSSYLTMDDIVVDAATGEVLDGMTPEQVVWSEERFEQALWSLVWRGLVTNSSFTPVRALERGAMRRRPPARSRSGAARRVRARMLMPPSLAGLWSLVGALAPGVQQDGEYDGHDGLDETDAPERAAIAQVEALLDRYGIVAQPLVDKEELPGGFSALYPLLKRMEEHGRLVRGMFVHGFGAAQFAEKSTVDALRRHSARQGGGAVAGGAGRGMDGGGEGSSAAPPDAARGHRPSPSVASCVAMSALDPANLYGTAIPWPVVAAGAAKPTRRDGGLVVMRDGVPMLFASVRGHRLTTFPLSPGRDAGNGTGDGAGADAPMADAFETLAGMLRRAGIASAVFADMDGESLAARGAHCPMLRQAGFVPTPQGMRLY